MMKRFLTLFLAGLLAQTLPVATHASAKTQGERDAQVLEKVRRKIARLGVGERAKTTVWLKDGTKIKGYISQAREADLVVRDRKTDTPTPIFYQDIARVDDNRGHGTLKLIGIGAAIGGGIIVALALVAAATFD
jgi:hypothetical protein